MQELLNGTTGDFFESYGAHHTRLVIPNDDGNKNIGGNPKVRGNEDDFARGLVHGENLREDLPSMMVDLMEGKALPDLNLDEEIAVAALAGDSTICQVKSIDSRLLPRTLTGIRLSGVEKQKIFTGICDWLKTRDIEVQLAFVKTMNMDFIREYNITRTPGFMDVIMHVREELKNGYIRKNPDSYFHGIILGVKAAGREIHELEEGHVPGPGSSNRIFYMFGSEDEVRSLIPEIKEIFDTVEVMRG